MLEPCGRVFWEYLNIWIHILVPGHMILFLVLGLNFSCGLWFLYVFHFVFGASIHLFKEITLIINLFLYQYCVHCKWRNERQTSWCSECNGGNKLYILIHKHNHPLIMFLWLNLAVEIKYGCLISTVIKFKLWSHYANTFVNSPQLLATVEFTTSWCRCLLGWCILSELAYVKKEAICENKWYSPMFYFSFCSLTSLNMTAVFIIQTRLYAD